MNHKDEHIDDIEQPEEDTSVKVDNKDSDDSQDKGFRSRRKDKKADKKKEIEELKQENAELKDKFLRLFAEFDNFKKRTVREKLDTMRLAAQDTLSSLLPVLDDFDRAKQNADDPNSPEEFSEGVRMVYNKLWNTLKAQGLEPMESTGADFDPELHEAVTEFPAPSEDMKGKVVDTIEKGYYLKDKIIRHAKVVVGK